MSNHNPNMRTTLLELVQNTMCSLPELEAEILLADWRERGSADTQALAEFLEVSTEAVVTSRESGRRKVLESARAVTELADWETLRSTVIGEPVPGGSG